MLALTWRKDIYNVPGLSADLSDDSLDYRFALVWVECEVNMRILLLVFLCLVAFCLGLSFAIGIETVKLILKRWKFLKLEKRIESQVDKE